MDLDNDNSIEARRQNVEFGCPCSANLCLHGGTCVNAVPPYCLCPPGWSGPTCETIVTAPNPGWLSVRLQARVFLKKLRQGILVEYFINSTSKENMKIVVLLRKTLKR